MKAKFTTLFLSILIALGSIAVSSDTYAYWCANGRCYHSHYYYGGGMRCRWVNGYWANGYWHAAHRVCWR